LLALLRAEHLPRNHAANCDEQNRERDLETLWHGVSIADLREKASVSHAESARADHVSFHPQCRNKVPFVAPFLCGKRAACFCES
jgi:hypothetical protein